MLNNMRSAPALRKLPEQELQQILHNIATLQANLQSMPLVEDELAVEAVLIRGALNRWYDLAEGILKARQRDATYHELCNWDNEGGSVPPTIQVNGQQEAF